MGGRCSKSKAQKTDFPQSGQKRPCGTEERKGIHPRMACYFRIASMKSTMVGWDGWLRRRILMYIWNQWKKSGRV